MTAEEAPTRSQSAADRDSSDEPDYRSILEATLGIPFTRGNLIRVLKNGDEIFPAMLDAIAAAQTSIEFVTFVYWQGGIARRFADALAERAKAGVKVRVILDAIGAKQMPGDVLKIMKDGEVEIIWFRPPIRWKVWEIDNRTHRKILVCDGEVGFTGGVGIAEQWDGDARNENEWRETHFEVRGPAVHGLQAAFIDNWVESDRLARHDVTCIRPLEPVGSSEVAVLRTAAAVNWSNIATMFHVLLTMARRKVRITTAYFVPAPSLVELLKETAARGVDVQIMIPGPHHDERLAQLAQQETYVPLMEAGVRLFTFQPSMLHAKICTVDDAVAAVGSANFNQRSMSKDDEVVMMLLDRSIVATLDRHFEEDRQRCVELDASRFRRRNPVWRAASRFVSLFRQEM